MNITFTKTWYGILAILFLPIFLHAQSANIGDFVFKDSNSNGIQDAGESGVSGAFVMLTTCAGDYITHTTTDANGAYLFTDIQPGSYKIKFALSPGYNKYSPMNQGNNTALDSDVIPGWTAYTECFDVTGADDMTIDAGFIPDGSNQTTEVSISCIADMEVPATTTREITRSFFGDKKNNAVVVINVEDFEKTALIPTGHQITYTADKVGNTGKVYVVNRGSDAMDVIDVVNLELTKTIPLTHHPRSAEAVNTNLGLAAVTGMDKPMVSIIDINTDEVVAVVGSSEVTYPVTHNHTGSHACGHPFWLNDHHFVLPDRGNLLLYCYSIYKVNGAWETTLLSTTMTPSPVHQILPFKHYSGPANIFYASAEGMTKEGVNNVRPAILELQFSPTTGLHISRALTLEKAGIAVEDMGGHHADFHPFEKKIYVGSREGTLFIVDYETMTIHSTIQAGNGIGHTKMVPSKNLAICINHKDVFVTIVDLSTNTKIMDIPVSQSIDKVGQTTLQAHPKQYVIGDNFYSYTPYDGNFYELDLNTLNLSRLLHIGGTPTQGAFVAMTIDAAPVAWAIPTATSTCPGNVTLTQISGPTSGNIIPQGNHIITYVASDECGNTDTCHFNLFITPQQPSGPANIGNMVFSDNNGNGIQDAGELGVSDAFVMLMNCDGDYVTHTTTDAAGHYLFEEITPGSYKVKFALKAGYQFSPTNVGTDGTVDSDVLPGWSGHTACFDMTGADRMDIDAGFIPDVPPAGEITMNCTADLTASLPVGQNSMIVNWSIPNATTTCNSGGLTLAQTAGPLNGSSLIAGIYDIAYQATDACGNVKTCNFTLTVSGGQMASVSNQVWADLNGNGLQDAGEPGLSGVFVMLTDCDENWMNNVFTDANGNYQFNDLTPGYYKIKFALLPDYVYSPTNAGSNSALDSDVLPGWLGFTACFNLASGENRTDIDAGFILDGSLGYTNASDQFIDLTINQDKFTAALSWQNNTGDINTFFLIERALDGGSFEPLAQVKQQSNTQKIVSFDYLDTEPLAGKNIYRVRAITNKGNNLFSNSVDAAFDLRNQVTIYPNPTSDYVMVDLLPFKGLDVRISITNEIGQVVKSIYLPTADAAPKRINLNSLKAGTYHVVIEDGAGRMVSKSLVVGKM